MATLKFFQFPIGKYCTAYEIGYKVKELTDNPSFFRDMNSDGQERIGRWVNAEVGKIYKNDTRYVLGGADAISLPYESNEHLLTHLSDAGLIESGWFIRHSKLDLYSARMAEMIIRSFTGNNSYQLSNDIQIEIDWYQTDVTWSHNDISKKYVHRKQRQLRMPGHKALF